MPELLNTGTVKAQASGGGWPWRSILPSWRSSPARVAATRTGRGSASRTVFRSVGTPCPMLLRTSQLAGSTSWRLRRHGPIRPLSTPFLLWSGVCSTLRAGTRWASCSRMRLRPRSDTSRWVRLQPPSVAPASSRLAAGSRLRLARWLPCLNSSIWVASSHLQPMAQCASMWLPRWLRFLQENAAVMQPVLGSGSRMACRCAGQLERCCSLRLTTCRTLGSFQSSFLSRQLRSVRFATFPSMPATSRSLRSFEPSRPQLQRCSGSIDWAGRPTSWQGTPSLSTHSRWVAGSDCSLGGAAHA